jgi:undecaprenyl-diphosphatase
MTDFINALILGVVEGVTEFLPISSTGHLILVNQWVSFPSKDFSNMFDVVIQLGAILAVVVYFWNRLWPFGAKKTLEEKKSMWLLWAKVIVGILPLGLLGFLFNDFVEEKLFGNTLVVAAALVGWGIVIILVETFRKPKSNEIAKANDIGFGMAVAIGFIQCLAMVPGTSRSAATIIGAMLLGCSRVAAAEFSFFLSIPTMVGVSLVSLLKHGSSMSAHDFAVLGAGFVTAFIVALVVIKFFMGFIQKHKFTAFGIYRIIIGAIVALLLFF